MRTHETVELAVIHIHKLLLELRRLGLQPFGKAVADLVNLGVGELYSLGIGHFYVVSVLILTDTLLDFRHSIVQGVFQQVHTVVCAIVTSDAKFLPYLHVLMLRVH